MFSYCTNLIQAPIIPESVINCYGMFVGCKSLRGTITINANPTNYSGMLGAAGNGNKIILTGDCSAEILEAIRQTGNTAYITVEK